MGIRLILNIDNFVARWYVIPVIVINITTTTTTIIIVIIIIATVIVAIDSIDVLMSLIVLLSKFLNKLLMEAASTT